jgi:hypothetical protein
MSQARQSSNQKAGQPRITYSGEAGTNEAGRNHELNEFNESGQRLAADAGITAGIPAGMPRIF